METLWETERRLQASALAAACRASRDRAGGPGSRDGSRDDWRRLDEVRARIADELRRMPAPEARRTLEDEVSRERRRVHLLEQGEATAILEGGTESTSEALYLASLVSGERLRWLRSLVDVVQGTVSSRHATLVEGELHWIDARVRELRDDSRLAAVAAELEARTRRRRHALQRSSAEQWLHRDGERGGAAAPGNAEEGGDAPRAAETFLSAWERVLEYHELASDLAVTHFPHEPLLEELAERRRRDLARCRESILAVAAPERERTILEAVNRTESHVSGLLSEGDLLDLDARPLKYRAAVAAVDDLDAVLESPEGDRQGWFDRGSERLRDFLRETRRLGWIRRYAGRSSRSAEVEARFEGILGRRWTRRVENIVFGLIMALVALVVVEWRMDAGGTLTPPVALGFQIADLVICTALLTELFLRWHCAGWELWFLRRHLVFDFLPALPYGFLFGALWHAAHFTEHGLSALVPPDSFLIDWLHHLEGRTMTEMPLAQYAHFLLILRVFRLVRVFRGVRAAVTTLRFFRLVVFVIRGSDRAVQRLRGFLDRNILVFEPFALQHDAGDPLASALSQHEARRLRLSRELFREVPWERRPGLLAAHLAVLEHEIASIPAGHARELERRSDTRDLHLESVIVKLMNCTPPALQSALGQKEIERIARLLRWIDLPVVRWLPLLRRWVRASRRPDPIEAVAEAARELGQFLQGILGIFYLGGDLSGITTGPQVLDRIATAMIKSTQRPAVRLILIGGVTLLFSMLFERVGLEVVDRVLEALGAPFVILGSLCLVINVLGRCFKRISGEALDVYLRTSEAHFSHLLNNEVKSRRLDEDLEVLRQRILLPESRVRELDAGATATSFEHLRARLATVHAGDGGSRGAGMVGIDDHGGGGDGLGPAAAAASESLAAYLYRDIEQIALLYRDYLDGRLLERTDDKTSIQLLGNLAIRDIRLSMLGMGRRDLRRLERLALEKDRMLGFGPYLWFRFISESLSIETAKLVMEYNSCCVPLERLPEAPAEARERFREFLERRRKTRGLSQRRRRRAPIDLDRTAMVTTEFHSLHFLLPDTERDGRILAIFGKAVHDSMIADRREMVRDIFGTWPYHLLPPSARRLNPYRLYFRYLGGARVLILPVVLSGAALAFAVRLLRQLVRIVREVLGTEDRRSRLHSRQAGFDVAVRKINRMRKPYFMEAMRLRAAVDAEYLGLRIPGMETSGVDHTYEDDLDFIGALERERLPFQEMRRTTLRDLRRLRVFLTERGWSGDGFRECLRALDPEGVHAGHDREVLRALVSAFITDQNGLRSAVTAPREIHDFLASSLDRAPAALLIRAWKGLYHHLLARALPGNRRRRRLFERYAAIDARIAGLDGRSRRRALLAFLDAPSRLARSCRIAVAAAESPGEYDRRILESLRRVASEHSLWNRKLMTLRVIQTLTVIDIRSYRDLIWSLGGYEDDTAAGPRAARALDQSVGMRQP